MELIKATVNSVNVTNSKNGDAGLLVVVDYDDGSDRGKRIWHWLWRGGNKVDKNLLDWAAIVDPDNKEANAEDAVLSGKLSDLVVDLIVDKTTGDFWDVKSVGLLGTLESPVETVPDDDDIPF